MSVVDTGFVGNVFTEGEEKNLDPAPPCCFQSAASSVENHGGDSRSPPSACLNGTVCMFQDAGSCLTGSSGGFSCPCPESRVLTLCHFARDSHDEDIPLSGRVCAGGAWVWTGELAGCLVVVRWVGLDWFCSAACVNDVILLQ